MRKLLVLCCLVGSLVSQAQVDPQFSQFYAAPLLINPGFTGATQEHRLIFNGRIQWPNLPKAYQTMAFSYDMYRPELRSGFGIQLLTDKAGSAGLRYTTARLNYSYKIVAQNWVISPGLYFGYSSRSFDPNKLIFGDQLDFGSGNIPPSSDPNVGKLQNSHFFDTGVGILMYNAKSWFGASVYQLNQPNATIIDGDSPWPMKFIVHAGTRIPLSTARNLSDNVSSLAPSIMYRTQGGVHQIDAGIQYLLMPVVVGVYYRGVPIMKNVIGNPSNEALIFNMGLIFNYFEFGYSYDFTLSELAANSGGAHELSLTYEFTLAPHPRRVKRKHKMLPCPTFNAKTSKGPGIFR